jgi:hypothetical protein
MGATCKFLIAYLKSAPFTTEAPPQKPQPKAKIVTKPVQLTSENLKRLDQEQAKRKGFGGAPRFEQAEVDTKGPLDPKVDATRSNLHQSKSVWK